MFGAQCIRHFQFFFFFFLCYRNTEENNQRKARKQQNNRGKTHRKKWRVKDSCKKLDEEKADNPGICKLKRYEKEDKKPEREREMERGEGRKTVRKKENTRERFFSFWFIKFSFPVNVPEYHN